MVVDKEELVRLQEEEIYVAKIKRSKRNSDKKRNTGFLMKNVEEFGTGYVSKRMKWELSESRFWCPSLLRAKAMEVDHDSSLDRHSGVKKTVDKIQTNFFWPGLHDHVTSFCQSCEVCQKTVLIGSVLRAPLEDMPLNDQTFQKSCD